MEAQSPGLEKRVFPLFIVSEVLLQSAPLCPVPSGNSPAIVLSGLHIRCVFANPVITRFSAVAMPEL